jgi:hypothetical protein
MVNSLFDKSFLWNSDTNTDLLLLLPRFPQGTLETPPWSLGPLMIMGEEPA